jgi:CheY-like chemotaxis protein
VTENFQFCWEAKGCDRTCSVKDSRSFFCWRAARDEGFQAPEICEVCSYRRKWVEGEYSVLKFTQRNDRRRHPRESVRILVVDDEPNILYALEETVRSAGYECLSASDGEEGLFLARQLKPSLVITDVIMPKVNGYELCQAVKFGEETRHIPVILCTVRGMAQDITLGEHFGADAYLVKPFQVHELTEKISSLVTARNKG